MQFRNILSNVKRGKKKKEKGRKPKAENNEVKDTTHFKGKLRKILRFEIFHSVPSYSFVEGKLEEFCSVWK